MKFSLMVFIMVLLMNLLPAQQNGRNIDQMQNQLKSIQQEINDLEKQLKTQDNQLNIETRSIGNLDKQISLTHDKINIYKDKIGVQKNLIEQLENQIDALEGKIKALQRIFREQVIFAYKYQRGKQYDWILGAASFNDIFVKYYYFRKVTSAERSIFQELRDAKISLSEKESRLNEEISINQEYLASATTEEKSLAGRRRTKSQVITEIKKNKTLLTQLLNEKRESLEQLKRILASLEKGRPQRQLGTETQIKWEQLSGSFAKNKGKFNWPVEGQLLHGFGRVRNPELKTVLNNTGIDIRAGRGSDVRCIFPGVISLITYMSGFGNMVIVDHNDGYYTVYAHLEEIFVKNGTFVEGGDRLGSVGESGSLEGPKLHFEIYGKDKNLDPLGWLKSK